MIKKREVIERKKGASHVDVIFSFILFVSFVIFMLIIFNPFKLSSKPTTALDLTENKIINNISVNLSAFSIKISASAYNPSAPCYYIASIAQSLSSDPLVMKNENGQTVKTFVSGGNIYFENSGNFYNLYYSEELIENTFSPSGCTQLVGNNYLIGIINYYKIISYSRLLALKTVYNLDYDNLKQNLGLDNEFSISLKQNHEIDFKMKKNKPSNIEISATNIPITILNENADLMPDILNIQVWD